MIKQLTQLQNRLKQNHHRALVVLHGTKSWQEKVLQAHAPQAHKLTNYQTKNLLGTETPGIIICSTTGILLETLAITSGTIKAGKILWLLLPEKLQSTTHQESSSFTNPASEKYLSYNQQPHTNFETYLLDTLKQHASWITESSCTIKLPPKQPTPKLASKLNNQTNNQPSNQLTSCQNQALQQILQLATSDHPYPIIISGKRGRGKTTLLGKAAAQLLTHNNLIITAPTYQQTATAFKHASQQLATPTNRNQLTYKNFTLSYKAPDDLLLNQPQTDLLFIDEAANLPLPLLENLLKTYPKTVLTTTLDGYEGTSQGFTQRLLPQLKKLHPQLKHLELKQPIRYQINDPLENLIDTLLFQTEQIETVSRKTTPTHLKFHSCKPTDLNQNQLKQLIHLLNSTHYQSSAGDLQQLLTAPDLKLHLAINSIQNQQDQQDQQDQIIGFLLTIQEGKISPLETNRRVKGHLIPQLLRQNFARETPLKLLTSRATRLGVKPQFRRQKIATQLIEHWQKTETPDYFSLSFGATPELHQLWQKHKFQTVHLGTKRDKASATYNLIMLKPNSPTSQIWINQLAQEFQQNLPNLLKQTHQDLTPPLPTQIQAEKQPAKTPNQLNQQKTPRNFKLQDFVNYPMPYESAEFKLQSWTQDNQKTLDKLPQKEQNIWHDKIIKQLNWQELIQKHQLIGQKKARQTLKEIAKKLISL